MLFGSLVILVHRATGPSQPEGPWREKDKALKTFDLIGQILELGFLSFNASFLPKKQHWLVTDWKGGKGENEKYEVQRALHAEKKAGWQQSAPMNLTYFEFL